MIEITNLYKSFGTQVVLRDLSLRIERGTTTAVVGPSGTGKSVLLKLIIGLLSPDSGRITIDGVAITECSSVSELHDITKRMGVLFQGAALFDSMRLIDNVAFPLLQRKLCSYDEAIERSVVAMRDVGLSGKELVYPGEVSIGMRKRVGVARALVTEPDLLLFDEPNTGLDPKVGQELYELIKRLESERDFTGIVISHEIPEVFQVCEQVVMLYQGKVQASGDVASFVESDNPVVRQFINGAIDGPIRVG